jgi:hypothetical protein
MWWKGFISAFFLSPAGQGEEIFDPGGKKKISLSKGKLV